MTALIEDILDKIGMPQKQFVSGEALCQANCRVCGKSFGWAISRRKADGLAVIEAKDVFVKPEYESVQSGDPVRCLHCNQNYPDIQTLFNIKLYEKE